MSVVTPPFVCRSCRHKLIATFASELPLIRRLSYARVQQYEEHSSSQEDVTRRSSPFQLLIDRLTNDSTPTNEEALKNQGLGRYSRGRLQPQQLLQQLRERGGSEKSQTKNTPDGAERVYKDVSRGTRHRDPVFAVAQSADKIVQLVETRKWYFAWRRLCALSRLTSFEHFDVLKGNLAFQEALGQLWKHLNRDWYYKISPPKATSPDVLSNEQIRENLRKELRSFDLSDVHRREETNFSPANVTRVFKSIGVLTPTVRAAMLCDLLSNLFWFQLDNGSESFPETRHHISENVMRLWHDAFATHLLRPPLAPEAFTSPQTDRTWDWSFIPPARALIAARREGQLTLDDALNLTLPHLGGSSRDGDFASAVILSRELLRSISTSEDGWSDELCGRSSDYEPLLRFFDDIVELTPSSHIPPYIRTRLSWTPHPMRSFCEDVVKRLGLQGKPVVPAGPHLAPLSAEKMALSTGSESSSSHGVSWKRITPQSVAASASETSSNPTEVSSATGFRFTPREHDNTHDAVQRFAEDAVKRCGRAVEQQNAGLAQRVYEKVLTYAQKTSPNTVFPFFLYEHLMSMFMALRLPEKAMAVWSDMQQAGLQPNVRTWTVMIRGSARTADPELTKKLWLGMCTSGVRPDAHAWNSRVFALINLGQIQPALAALQEMGDEWTHAQKVLNKAKSTAIRGISKTGGMFEEARDAPVKPTIAIANAAISALLGKRRGVAYVPEVLTWAMKMGLEPDIYTFNALISAAMRRGEVEEALLILQHMRKRHVEPDSNTSTVLLTAFFHSDLLQDLSHQEQSDKVMDIVESLETSGTEAKINEKGYAVAISRLLEMHQNEFGAQVLLKHMRERGLPPTSHIYTILMNFYLTQGEPNVNAVESLWAEISSANAGHGAALDSIFYDRALERYAEHHKVFGTTRIMATLDRMKKEGKQPSWRALHAVAHAFADANEWERLEKFVDDIRFTRGIVSSGVKRPIGQIDFWRFILRTGILERQGISTLDEVMQKNKAAEPNEHVDLN